MIKKLTITTLLFVLAFTVTAFARGGQSSDDCEPGSKDPDCKKHSEFPMPVGDRTQAFVR